MDKAEIEALKAGRPILQVLQDLGVETRNNRFRCPRPEGHSNGDRTPSVSVWPERNSFKCWVCADVHGDVIDLVRLVKGCTFREALEFLGASAAALRGGFQGQAQGPSRGPALAGTPMPLPFTAPLAAPSAAPAASPPLADPAQAPAPLPATSLPTSPGAPPRYPSRSADPEDIAQRQTILVALLNLAVPVAGPVARYLQKRRIFKRTWDGQRLRMIEDYAGVSAALERAFGRPALERAGFFNPAGHLRYYRHRLLFPYFDAMGKPVYLQARGIEEGVKPKELSMAGAIPIPYNVRLLDGEPGQIYLCEGVIDALTLIEQGFPAVGVPGAANFKPAWTAMFRNKSVHVAFDPDAPGENGAARTIEILQAGGVEARRLQPPKGLDLNDWFRKG